jgi:two-component system sensor histidine kinase/response regulator
MASADHGAVLELAGLIDMFGGDRAKVAKLLRRFAETSASGIAEMQACLAAGDVARMRELGHRIKSAARMVGADPMALLCERLETLPPADAATEQADAAALLARLLPMFTDVSARIDDYLAQPD